MAFSFKWPVNPVAFSQAVIAGLVDSSGNKFTSGNPMPVTVISGAGEAVTIADGADVAEGAKADAAYTDATGAASGSVIALLKAIAKSFLNGLAPGRAADAASTPVAISTEDVAILGIITETAPASDTASSGLNGRLQRIAQRITSLLAVFSNSFVNITTATTTAAIKTGAGTLHTVTINSLGTVASAVVIYDSLTGAGTKIATINSLSVLGTLTFDVAFATGLSIVTTGTVAPDVTVSYR